MTQHNGYEVFKARTYWTVTKDGKIVYLSATEEDAVRWAEAQVAK
jgi:hypothetical protein